MRLPDICLTVGETSVKPNQVISQVGIEPRPEAKLRISRQILPKKKGFAQYAAECTNPSQFIDFSLDGKKHQSPMLVSDIERDLCEFQNSIEMPTDPLLILSIAQARSTFYLHNAPKMLHLNEVFDEDSDIWDKSPGLPWKDYGYRTKGDIKRDVDAIQSIRRFWHYVKGERDYEAPDCMAFARAHICDSTERKVRAVWGYPATLTFGETVFARPLIDAYKQMAEHRRLWF